MDPSGYTQGVLFHQTSMVYQGKNSNEIPEARREIHLRIYYCSTYTTTFKRTSVRVSWIGQVNALGQAREQLEPFKSGVVVGPEDDLQSSSRDMRISVVLTQYAAERDAVVRVPRVLGEGAVRLSRVRLVDVFNGEEVIGTLKVIGQLLQPEAFAWQGNCGG